MKMRLNQSGIRWLGLGLLAYVMMTSDWGLISGAFGRISYSELVLITLLGTLIWVIKAWRWRYLLSLQSVHYPFGRALLVYVYTMGMGFLSPARAGEFLKITFVHDEAGASLAQGLVSVVCDRSFDFLMLCLAAILGGGVFVLHLTSLSAAVVTLAVLLLVVLLVLLFLHLRPGRLWSRFMHRLSTYGRWGGMAASGGDALARETVNLLQPRLLAAFAATALATAVFFWQSVLFARQLGLPLTFLQVAYALSLASIVSLLPVSIAGLGTRDVTVIYAFGLFGVSQSEALSYSLLIFAVYLVVTVLVTAVLSLVIRSDQARGELSENRAADD